MSAALAILKTSLKLRVRHAVLGGAGRAKIGGRIGDLLEPSRRSTMRWAPVARTDRELISYPNEPGSRNPRLHDPLFERHIARKTALARTRALGQESLTSFRF
jgi:hypothetical protein